MSCNKTKFGRDWPGKQRKIAGKSAVVAMVTTLGAAGLIVPAQASFASTTANQVYTYDEQGDIIGQYPCNSNREWINPASPIAIVDNTQCTGRVWLHQNINNTGWTFCISGGAFEAILRQYQHPGNIQATRNTAPCP